MMKKNILGWVTVSFSLVISCLWAYWGIGENFHNGWLCSTLHGLQDVGVEKLDWLSLVNT
jgi:hypothetical protein